MRKIILGLFLTGGTSGLALANTIIEENDFYDNNSFVSTCYTQVIVNHETTCGVYVYSTASPKYAVNCFEGQTAGTTTTYYETRLVSGWNPGSGPVQATNCLD